MYLKVEYISLCSQRCNEGFLFDFGNLKRLSRSRESLRGFLDFSQLSYEQIYLTH